MGAQHSACCLVVANQKGGVGKTTTAVNLSAALSRIGKRVLVVDLDPQGNLSQYFGIKTESLEFSVYDLLINASSSLKHLKSDANFENVVQEHQVKGSHKTLEILPADLDLSLFDMTVSMVPRREYLLQQVLSSYKELFDYIILDAPPSLGLLTLNALVAADQVLIPYQPEFFAMKGITRLLDLVDTVQNESLNPELSVLGLLPTLMDKRLVVTREALSEVKNAFPDYALPAGIHRNVSLTESTGSSGSVFDYHPSSKGAKEYMDLGQMIIERIG